MFANIIQAPLYNGYLIQSWSSDDMMQTIPIADITSHGFDALWFNHMYPPLLDSVRYLLVLPEVLLGDEISTQLVDQRMYVVNALLYGVTNSVLYLWIRDVTGNGWWALMVTVLWAVSPGYIMAMQLLETTPIALTLTTTMFFFLFRFLRSRRGIYSVLFLLCLFFLSLTRNTVQIYGILLLIVTLVYFWRKSNIKKLSFAVLNILLVLLIVALPTKQSILFGSFDASSFSGYHRAGMLWVDPRDVPHKPLPTNVAKNASRLKSQFNNPEQLADNLRLSAAANQLLLTDPLGAARGLGRSLMITTPELLRPTADYVTDNLFVLAMPHRNAWNWIDSGWRLPALTALFVFLYLLTSKPVTLRRHIREYWLFLAYYAIVAAPVLWSNRYWPGEESLGPIWTDSVRLKIFLVPPLLAFAAYTLKRSVARLITSSSAPTATAMSRT